MIKLLFYASLFSLIYIYFGYYALLRVFNYFVGSKEYRPPGNISRPLISILISAYNEEAKIKTRIHNILKSNYPCEKIEIVIASDGSTDNTVQIARQVKKSNISILDFSHNRGRAMIQNDGVQESRGDIIVFTDATTEFTPNFLDYIAMAFSVEEVGCVVGNLYYKTRGDTISESEGAYWRYEKKLRELENSLGILATATGACMAVKKELWRNLAPEDDCDFTTPLDVILQGKRVVFVSEAIAYDVPPSSIKREIKVRIRQTSKNLAGTLRRWGWKGWIKHPIISWALLSHKILRWLTPFFMIGSFLSNLYLLNDGIVYQITFAGQIVFYTLAILGLVGELLKRRIVFASTIFSFCVANIGMGIGVIKGLLGRAPAAFKHE